MQKEKVKKPEILNLKYHERILILKALHLSRGYIQKAYELNVGEGPSITMEAYRKKLYYHGISASEIKKQYKDAESKGISK